ncbi:MAG: hypothetical protein JW942_02995 [Opitutales bacterium]|nr:hypothetical protein [Opitutales bacterium]
MRPSIIAALIVTGTTLFCGCASYKPGAGAQGTVQSIWVAPAVNNSYMPQIATLVSEHVRESFLSDNLVRLVRKDAADAKLEVTILAVSREGRAEGVGIINPNGQGSSVDKGLYQAIDVTISARAVLTSNANGEVLFEHTFETSTQTVPDFYISSSADAERMLMPVLARDLARQIHDAIAARWDDDNTGNE